MSSPGAPASSSPVAGIGTVSAQPKPDLGQELLAAVRRRDAGTTAALVSRWRQERGVASLTAFRTTTLAIQTGPADCEWLAEVLRSPAARGASPQSAAARKAAEPQAIQAEAEIALAGEAVTVKGVSGEAAALEAKDLQKPALEEGSLEQLSLEEVAPEAVSPEPVRAAAGSVAPAAVEAFAAASTPAAVGAAASPLPAPVSLTLTSATADHTNSDAGNIPAASTWTAETPFRSPISFELRRPSPSNAAVLNADDTAAAPVPATAAAAAEDSDPSSMAADAPSARMGAWRQRLLQRLASAKPTGWSWSQRLPRGRRLRRLLADCLGELTSTFRGPLPADEAWQEEAMPEPAAPGSGDLHTGGAFTMQQPSSTASSAGTTGSAARTSQPERGTRVVPFRVPPAPAIAEALARGTADPAPRLQLDGTPAPAPAALADLRAWLPEGSDASQQELPHAC